MAAPTYQAQGAVGTPGVGSISVSWPVHAVNDIAVLFLISPNDPPTGITSGWTLIDNIGNGTSGGGTASGIWAYWKRATSTSEAAVTVTFANIMYGIIQTYRGCDTTGNPINAHSSSTYLVSGYTRTILGITTTVANTLTVTASDFHYPANSSTSWIQNTVAHTERYFGNLNSALNAYKFGVADNANAIIGATGSMNWTVSGVVSINSSVGLMFALQGPSLSSSSNMLFFF